MTLFAGFYIVSELDTIVIFTNIPHFCQPLPTSNTETPQVFYPPETLIKMTNYFPKWLY